MHQVLHAKRHLCRPAVRLFHKGCAAERCTRAQQVQRAVIPQLHQPQVDPAARGDHRFMRPAFPHGVVREWHGHDEIFLIDF